MDANGVYKPTNIPGHHPRSPCHLTEAPPNLPGFPPILPGALIEANLVAKWLNIGRPGQVEDQHW